MNEMEVRVLKIDPDTIRKIMKENDIPCVKKEDQVNNLFDFEDGRLLKNSGYARIRAIHDLIKKETHYYMTVKKMINNDKYKIMEENEVEIEDGKEGEKILNALGLKKIETIPKYRESYKYKNVLIEIDINDVNFFKYPYIEVEGNSEEEIKEALNLMGYTLEDSTSETIFKLKEKIEKGLL